MAGNEYDPDAAEINFDTLHLESLTYNIAYDIIRVEYKVGKVKLFHTLPFDQDFWFIQSFQTDDERPTFRPFTRESLAKIEARIQEHNAKTKDLEKKRAEGEVRFNQQLLNHVLLLFTLLWQCCQLAISRQTCFGSELDRIGNTVLCPL